MAYAIRHQHQELWYQVGRELRDHNPGVLVRLALKEGPVIAGVRDKEEIEYVCRDRAVDHILWIDRPWCVDNTLKFTKEDCYRACEESGWRVKFGIINNAKSHANLYRELTDFCKTHSIPLKRSLRQYKNMAVKPLPPVRLDVL